LKELYYCGECVILIVLIAFALIALQST